MEEDAESYRPALAIMRTWQWTAFDPDGNPKRIGLDLSEVVNRLAMEGLPNPQTTVLALLCRSQLLGFSQFKWRKYHRKNHFQLEEYDALVTCKQWQALQDSLDEEKQRIGGYGRSSRPIYFKMLQIDNCLRHEWCFLENRFSFAKSPFYDVHSEEYFEEWFSAWDIEIRLPEQHADAPKSELNEEVSQPLAIGRPLAAWWPDFVAELVAYTVEVGLPPGIGHQGQSEVIKEVCARLQERGKEEPSRTQIQESVNAVLRRMRSAGNSALQ